MRDTSKIEEDLNSEGKGDKGKLTERMSEKTAMNNTINYLLEDADNPCKTVYNYAHICKIRSSHCG